MLCKQLSIVVKFFWSMMSVCAFLVQQGQVAPHYKADAGARHSSRGAVSQ